MLKVTVFLCLCFLIEDVLPSTTGLATTNKKKLRLCVSRERKTDKLKNNCLILGLEDSGVECVEGKDQLECFRHISNGSADFGVFNPEDLVAAQPEDDTTVIAEIRTSDRSFQRYVVAVVDNSVLVDRPGRLHAVLKDRVLCHPGTDAGHLSAYSQTLNGYLEFLVQQPSECSNDENRIKTLADYFGRSCKAGPWVPDRLRDNELKRQYSSLCAACGSGTCSAKDRYWGALGALACVVEVGEVAWAELSHVESFFSGSFFGLLSNREGPYLTRENFALLCPDYSSQAIVNATESCVWLHQPWPAIVARGNKLLSVEKLTRTMTSSTKSTGFWRSALQAVLGTGSATLTPLEYPVTAVDYLAKARGFQDAYSVKPCKEDPKKTFKCRNGVIISLYKVCDGIKDCADGGDETFRTCRRNACADDMFRCAYGGCLDADVECNGKVDCPDGSDEFKDLCEIPDDATGEPPNTEDILPTNPPQTTTTNRPTPRPTPRPTERPTTNGSEKKLCVLPPFPKHGTYVVTSYPDAVPGQTFDSVHYSVTCDSGYTVIGGKKDRICFQGIWSDEISSCVRFCSLPKDPSIDYQCPDSKNPLDDSNIRTCNTQEPDGTVVIPACKAPNYYFPGVLQPMRCIDGLWDYIAKCIPECGYLSLPEDQLLFGGRKAGRGELPWNAVIYGKKNNKYVLYCGGTLVSTKAVISAAHCFWSESRSKVEPTSNYVVALGKIERDYNSSVEELPHVQKSEVSEIHIPPRFRGSLTNFQEDIAVVIMEQSVLFNIFIRPACIDFSILFEKRQLQDGSVGKIATWAQTTFEVEHRSLRVLKLPYVPIEECLEDSQPNFRPYITGDKFCAGYRNGSAICKGDSGGGLVFPEIDRGRTRYYLRGVASVGPTSEKFCTLTWLTTFTQISRHEHFLKSYI